MTGTNEISFDELREYAGEEIALDAAIEQARDQALEEAAALLIEEASHKQPRTGTRECLLRCAGRIRALKA